MERKKILDSNKTKQEGLVLEGKMKWSRWRRIIRLTNLIDQTGYWDRWRKE